MSTGNLTSFVPWANVAHRIAQSGLALTFLFCYVLIYLTVFHVKGIFDGYKKLLLVSPTLGIFFACMELFLAPYVHSFNSGFLYYCLHPPSFLPSKVVEWLLAFYTGIYAISITVITNQFVYRYLAVFNEKKLKYFQGWYFVLVMGYTFSVGVQYACSIFYFMELDEYSKNYLREDIRRRYERSIDGIIGKSIVAYDAQGNVRWWNVYAIIDMTSTIVLQYVLIIYCAIKMHLDMEERLTMVSSTIKALHRQIFKTLVLQITAPTIFLFSPVVVTIFLPLFDMRISLPTGCFLTTFSLYPAIDALIIMCIVSEYRSCFKDILRRALKRMIQALAYEESEVSESHPEHIQRAMNTT